jgi:Tfp pilus assembly protein PilN
VLYVLLGGVGLIVALVAGWGVMQYAEHRDKARRKALLAKKNKKRRRFEDEDDYEDDEDDDYDDRPRMARRPRR